MRDTRLTIYPTAIKVEHHLLRLSAASECVIGHRITTLPQVVESLWRESRRPGLALTTSSERAAAFEAWMRSHPKNGKGGSARGVFESCSSLLQSLKGSGIGNAQWQMCVEKLGDADRDRLFEISEFFNCYEVLLRHRSAFDYHDREAAALEFLLQTERDRTLPRLLRGVTSLHLAEVYDLSLLQFMIVAALIRIVGDAEVTIQAEPRKVDVFRFANLTWNRFVGEESIANSVLPDFVRRGGRQGTLGYVVAHVFEAQAEREEPPSDNSLLLRIAASPSDEVKDAAHFIRDQIEANPAISLSRIGIVARNIEDYRDYLTRAFARARIPLALHSSSRLGASLPARALLDLLRIPVGGYRRSALSALSETQFIEPGIDRFKAVLEQCGYVDQATRPLQECLDQYRIRLDQAVGTASDDDREKLTGIVERFAGGANAWIKLIRCLAAIDRSATLAEHLVGLRLMLDELRFDPLRMSVTDTVAYAAAALERCLLELSEAALQLELKQNLTLADLVDLLQQLFENTPIAEPNGGPEGVQALSVRDARGLDFDQLFILGLNEGRFPRPHPQEPLLPDELRRAINRALAGPLRQRLGAAMPDAPGPLLRSSADLDSEEPFLFFLALSMPRDAIVLSCAREDETGRPLGRSPFFNEVAALIGEDRVTNVAALSQESTQASDIHEFLVAAALERLDETSQIAAGVEPSQMQSITHRGEIEQARDWYLAQPTREELKAARRAPREQWLDFATDLAPDPAKSRRAGAFDGRVRMSEDLGRFLVNLSGGGVARPWSATQLTELASCGFKFFAHRILRLGEAAALDNEVTTAETGELLHKILHDIFEVKPNFGDPSAAHQTAQTIAEHRRQQARGEARDPAFFDISWERIRETIREVIQYEIDHRTLSGERLLEHEFAFDLAGADATAGDIALKVAGRIDRVELERDAAQRVVAVRVLDYKDSKSLKHLAQLVEKNEFGAHDLQLPVYLLGVLREDALRLSPAATLQAGYWALKHRSKATELLMIPRAMLEDSASHTAGGPIAQRIIALVGSAIEGHFDVDPLSCSDYCPYRQVCRIGNIKG